MSCLSEQTDKQTQTNIQTYKHKQTNLPGIPLIGFSHIFILNSYTTLPSRMTCLESICTVYFSRCVEFRKFFRFVSISAGNVPRLGAIQTLNVAAASDYHTFTYNGDWYLVVLSDKATGPLMTSRESDGSSFTEQLGTGSTLYRWQGVFVPVQVKITF